MYASKVKKLKEDVNDLQRYYDVDVEPDVYIDGYCVKLNHDKAVKYDPCSNSKQGTFVDFHKDNSPFRLMMGGFGSGKSTCCCNEIILQLYNMPPMKDGIRRAKGAIVRNTMGELESTTMATWTKWFGNTSLGFFLGKQTIRKKPNLIYKYKYSDNRGKCELELICIGLDREDQKQKLESLELTFAYVNEAQHVPQGVIMHLLGRVGRFPAQDDITEDYFAYVIADTNPPYTSHWMYKEFEGENKYSGNKIFHQPPGLIKNKDGFWIDNIEADNFMHLKKNYYFNMARANSFNEQYIKVICNGQYGLSKKGKSVYSEYNDDLHSRDIVDVIEDLPIVIAVDGGSTPAALLGQLTESGQMRFFKEFTTHFSSARSLKENHVIPYVDKYLKGYKILIIHDPSMSKSNENIEVSAAQIWEDTRWTVEPAKSNYIDPRLEAQKSFLNKMVDGEPAFILSRTGCPILREAMASEYIYDEVKGKNEGTFKDIPNKSHPYSDIADCGQYMALEFSGDGIRIEQEPDIDLDEFTESNLNSGWV